MRMADRLFEEAQNERLAKITVRVAKRAKLNDFDRAMWAHARHGAPLPPVPDFRKVR